MASSSVEHVVQSNPYHPTPGVLPEAMPGREEQLAWWSVCVRDARAMGHTYQRSRVITGVRGIGKTVLANHIARDAKEHGWTVVWRQASEADAESDINAIVYGLADEPMELPETTEHWVPSGGSLGLAGVSGAVSGTVVPGVREPVTDRWIYDTFRSAAREAGERKAGVLVVVDEAHVMTMSGLRQLGTAVHRFSQSADRVPPIVVLLAGLPGLRKRVFDAITHTDRLFDFVELGNLSPADVARALEGPAAKRGVRWQPAAIGFVAERSQGYPAFVQEYGAAAWDAKIRDIVTRADAERGEAAARVRISTQYESVWLKASPLGKRYLRALAAHAGHAPNAVLAADLHRSTGQLSSLLAGFKARGDLHHNDAGEVELSRPGMDAWIRALPSDD